MHGPSCTQHSSAVLCLSSPIRLLLWRLLSGKRGPVCLWVYREKRNYYYPSPPPGLTSWLVRSTPDWEVQFLGGDITLCSWVIHLTVTVPLSIQVYKWEPANLMLEVISSHLGENRNTPSRLLLLKPGIIASLVDHLSRIQTFLPTQKKLRTTSSC